MSLRKGSGRRRYPTAATRAAEGPNAEQIQYWNEISGSKWVALADQIDRTIEAFGSATMDALGVAERDQIVDIGCGCGHSTLELVERVGARGSVTGVDISATMLEVARRRAAERDKKNAFFENLDAQVDDLGMDRFDSAYSRFGVMFFADPRAAFTNIRRALRPGGRVGFVCWQPIASNAWVRVPLEAAARHVQLPPPPPPGTPGPFSFADPEKVRDALEGAGFHHVVIDPFEATMEIGGTDSLDEAVDFILRIGPTARALAEVDDNVKRLVRESLHEALTPHSTRAGVRLGGAAWIVIARR